MESKINRRDCQGEGDKCYVHGYACKIFREDDEKATVLGDRLKAMWHGGHDIHENHIINVMGPYGLNTELWKMYDVVCSTCRAAGVTWNSCTVPIHVPDW